MELVGPPARSDVYRIVAERTSYVPNELVQLRIEVTAREIQAMRKAGTAQCYCEEKNANNKRCPDESGVCDCVCTAAGECTHPEGTARKVTRGCTLTGAVMETSKYLGLLMYAVKAGDPDETKVGGWEVPVEPSARFKTMGGPGCDDRALVQTGAGAKLFAETFWWRAPEAGTGPVVMRALLKQGETLGGHFYWPDAGNGDGTPAPGVAGGDLVLTEGAPTAPAAIKWVRGKPGESCDAVCAAAGRSCDPSAFSDAGSSGALLSRVSASYVCAAPLLSSCEAYAPTGSGGGTGWCWFADSDTCAADFSPPQCGASAPGEMADAAGLRFCPCAAARRRLNGGLSNVKELPAGHVAELPAGHVALKPNSTNPCPFSQPPSARGEPSAPRRILAEMGRAPTPARTLTSHPLAMIGAALAVAAAYARRRSRAAVVAPAESRCSIDSEHIYGGSWVYR